MAVRKMTLLFTFMACFALAGSAWANSYTFNAPFMNTGQGALSFTPGVGNTLAIGAGNGGNGALITDFFNTENICGGDCAIVGGYLTLTSGKETSGFAGGGSFAYTYAAGGSMQIFGKIPSLGINVSTLLFSAGMLAGSSFSGGGGIGSYAANIDTNSIILNAALGKYHYISAMSDQLSFNISPTCGTGGICTGAINQSVQTFQIPEPATLSVLGVGLFTFGTGLRRRMLTR